MGLCGGMQILVPSVDISTFSKHLPRFKFTLRTNTFAEPRRNLTFLQFFQ